MFPQDLVHGIRKPRKVTELESAAQAGWQCAQEIPQCHRVSLEVGRQLEQRWAELAGAQQRLQRAHKSAHHLVRIFQALDVCNHLMGLNAKAELLGRFGNPVQQAFLAREMAEGVVHLHGVQPSSVIVQEFFLGQFGRIKGRLPVWVCPARSPCMQFGHDNSPRSCSSRLVSGEMLFWKLLPPEWCSWAAPLAWSLDDQLRRLAI